MRRLLVLKIMVITVFIVAVLVVRGGVAIMLSSASI